MSRQRYQRSENSNTCNSTGKEILLPKSSNDFKSILKPNRKSTDKNKRKIMSATSVDLPTTPSMDSDSADDGCIPKRMDSTEESDGEAGTYCADVNERLQRQHQQQQQQHQQQQNDSRSESTVSDGRSTFAVPKDMRSQVTVRTCNRTFAIRRRWTSEEDEKVRNLVVKYGIKAWGAIAKELDGRTAPRIRTRWYYALDPSIKKSNWTSEEDTVILEGMRRGDSFSKIAKSLSGRPDIRVGNRFKGPLSNVLRLKEKNIHLCLDKDISEVVLEIHGRGQSAASSNICSTRKPFLPLDHTSCSPIPPQGMNTIASGLPKPERALSDQGKSPAEDRPDLKRKKQSKEIFARKETRRATEININSAEDATIQSDVEMSSALEK